MSNFIAGIGQDFTYLHQPKGRPRKVINMVYSEEYDCYKNEDGFINLPGYQNLNLIPCGIVVGNYGEKVFFSCSPSPFTIGGTSYIHKEIGGVFTQIYQSDLGFNPRYIIKGLIFYNNLKQLIVVFWDDLNRPRYVNVDNPQVNDNQLNIFPDANNVAMTFTELVAGALQSGAYYMFITYYNLDGLQSNSLNIHKPIFITNSIYNGNPDIYQGDKEIVTTTKAIQIDIAGLDTRFDRYKIQVIKSQNGILTAYEIADLSINKSSFLYTGVQQETEINISEILVDKPSYINVKAGLYFENTIYFANLKQQFLNDFQKYANNISLKGIGEYVENPRSITESSKVIGYNHTKKTFQHGEVVAFYIAARFTDGTLSQLFHIPGKRITTITHGGKTINQNAIIAPTDIGADPTQIGYDVHTELEDDSTLNTTVRYHETRDTATNFNTVATRRVEFDFGYFENQDELYADREDFDVFDSTGQIDSIRNEKVRHHKFPSIRRMKEYWDSTADQNYGGRDFDVLGVKIENGSLFIPTELASIVQGFEVFYAKRTNENITCLGTSPLVQWYSKTGGELYSAGGHFITDSNFNQWENVYSLHALELIRNKPSLGTYVRQEILYNFEKVGFWDGSGGPFNNDQGIDKRYAYTGSAAGIGQKFTYEMKFSDNAAATMANLSLDDVTDDRFIRKVTNKLFVANNSIISYSTTLHNNLKEESCVFTVEEATATNLMSGASRIVGPLVNTNASLGTISIFLSTLCQYRDSAYTGFNRQSEFVSNGIIIPLGATTEDYELFGGDCFLNHHTFVTYGERDDSGFQTHPLTGIGVKYEVYNSSPINSNFRNNDVFTLINDSSIYTGFFPPLETAAVFKDLAPNGTDTYDSTLDKFRLTTYYRDIEPNQAPYLIDYSRILDIEVVSPYNWEQDTVERFSFRVIRNRGYVREEREGTIARFLPNDYFEISKEKGEIINLETRGRELLIHAEFTLLETQARRNLMTNEDTVYLGEQDLFAFEPKEVIYDKKGTAGTQHQLSCYMSKYGYCFADVDQGTFYIYADKLYPISDEGVKREFRDKFLHFFLLDVLTVDQKALVAKDNPLFRYGIGLTVCYDQKWKRLIIAKKDYSPLFSFRDFSTTTVTPPINGEVIFKNGIFYLVKTVIVDPLPTNEETYIDFPDTDKIGEAIQFTNEAYFEDKCQTVSYNFIQKGFSSFHTYKPHLLFNDRNDHFSMKLRNYYQHNHTNKCIFYDGTPEQSSMVVVMGNDENSKMFNLIKWITKLSQDGIIIREESFNEIEVWDEERACFHVLDYFTDPNNFRTENVRNIKNTWNFNRFRDAVLNTSVIVVLDESLNRANIGIKPVIGRKRFMGKFLVVNLLYNNEIISNLQRDFFAQDIDCEYTVVTR